MQEAILIIFYVAILLYSVIIHEVSHGLVALWLGDATAKFAGRLTANPLKHIDPMMTIMVPILMLIATQGRFAFGGAKPVPYNPYNLKNQKWGPALVAFAGPLSNIIIALVFAVIAKYISVTSGLKIDIIGYFIPVGATLHVMDWSGLAREISGSADAILFTLCSMIIFWNVLLAFFNLIPIPPLDGSKLLFAVLPIKIETMAIMEQYGFVFLLLFILLFSGLVGSILYFFWLIFFNISI